MSQGGRGLVLLERWALVLLHWQHCERILIGRSGGSSALELIWVFAVAVRLAPKRGLEGSASVSDIVSLEGLRALLSA